MPHSISIRHVEQFNMNNNKINIEKSSENIGSIEKTNKKIFINGCSLEIYKCTYKKDVLDNITVFVEELDKYEQINKYKKESSFNIFYCENKKVLFSNSTVSVTKGFLKELKSCEDITLEYSTPKFELQKINSMLINTKGIGFTSNDKGVNSKTFYGDNPVNNDEANKALNDNQSMRLMGIIEIKDKQYTVQFTQSGSFVAYSNIENQSDQIEYSMLQFTFDVLMKIGFFN